MLTGINSKQADKLADFFFDIGKGVALGVLGLSVSLNDVSPFARVFNALVGAFVVYLCVRVGLLLINKHD